MILSFEGKVPHIDPSAFVAHSADLVGDVLIGAQCSILYQAVLRADNNRIEIGERSNVQDGAIIHCDPGHLFGTPVSIGCDVSIGHGARLHGCRIGDRCIIGIGAIILDGAEVGAGSFVAAGTLITPNKKIPPGSFVLGSPAIVKREVSEGDRRIIAIAADMYVALGRRHRNIGHLGSSLHPTVEEKCV